MSSQPFNASIRIDDEIFDVTLIAFDSDAPLPDAPTGDGASLAQAGRLSVMVPDEHSHHLGVHADFGRTITLVDRGTETPCFMLMRVVGNPVCNGYLWLEPDHYYEWNYGV